MCEEQERFLRLPRWPATLCEQQVAWATGFTLDEIQILVRFDRLKPLGDPPRNGKKRFSTAKIQKWCARDENLDDAQRTIVRYWSDKNDSRHNKQAYDAECVRRPGRLSYA